MKRLYDAFPNRIWCISSLTLGLHIWETVRFPQTVELIHAVATPRLKGIGLGSTEVHPMFGRPFRRPFGTDYFTITDSGLLEHWTDQLDYFENVAETPTFAAIYREMRSQWQSSWAHFRRDWGHGTFRGYAQHSHLQKYFIERNWVSDREVEEEVKRCDLWAERGFPSQMPTSEGVIIDLGTKAAKASVRQAPACEITLAQVCNREWVQNCEKWAIAGLPCHDSILLVVSQLARWFFFIELWDISEDDRLEKIVSLADHLLPHEAQRIYFPIGGWFGGRCCRSCRSHY